MPYAECPPPDSTELAINRQDDLSQYQLSIAKSIIYWDRQLGEAEREVNIGLAEMAGTISGVIHHSYNEWAACAANTITDEFEVYRRRKNLLSTYAVGLFMRSFLNSESQKPIDVRDGVGVGSATVLLDIMTSVEGVVPSDSRVHLRFSQDQDRHEVWSMSTGLYTKQVAPSEMTPHLARLLEQSGMDAPASEFVTVYPYIPHRS